MQQIRIAIITLVLIAAAAVTVFSQNGRQLDSDEIEGGTIEGGETHFYTNSVATDLAPAGAFAQRIRDELTSLDPKVGIEIRIPIAVDPALFADDTTTPEAILAIYNILRRVSTMEGIEYYSASRGEMRTFYHESYAIAGPGNETRIADPTVTSIPRRDTIYVYQRDGSFGQNVQRIDYEFNGREILMSIVNLTTMVYKVIPLVTPENLQTFLLIQPNPDKGTIEFYGNLGVRVPGLFGMQDRARDSFYNRIVALHGWFANRLAAEGLAR